MGFLKSLMSVISTDGKTGTPFHLDKNHTVYYKGDGVSKIDAARVAGFFQGYGYFTDESQSDVQISSKTAGAPVQVGYIVGKASISPETETFFKGAATGLGELFPGRTISICLMNANLEHLKTL